ncbi:3-phosphoshikimate 1-carboxyvinyltransferase [Paucihalobacter sp.]|uniref:3-phosphoshikimate 1-carboxyvinyltransferase n=1 Tax=Paucihalobacter sp. TaxID=2850405 RepID=UPI002FE098C6
MTIQLQHSTLISNRKVTITGSKSESNRLLILKALYPNISIENLSNSDDTQVLNKALSTENHIVNIHHAGTAMRFLTSYFASKKGTDVILTGSQRMKERPIGLLVDALNALGANISFVENDGFPPLKIQGQELLKSEVILKANISSQFISSLMLIAPSLTNGLTIYLDGEITSRPYINMTLKLLQDLEVDARFDDQVITIKHKSQIPNSVEQKVIVESDWSSASYYYCLVALSDIGSRITLQFYKENSLQGDSVLSNLYKSFGVETQFANHEIILTKASTHEDEVTFDLNNCPDIAQTIAVTALALGVNCDLFGLHTLKIKETDRLVALQKEIEKLGGTIQVTDNSLHLKAVKNLNANVAIATYNDHRMAMAFAPLSLKVPIKIEDADVVSKSYPDFWKHLKSVGIQINE